MQEKNFGQQKKPTMQQTGKEQVTYDGNNATTKTSDSTTSRRSIVDRPLTSSAVGQHMRAGESSAPPQLSPHLSDETVDLVLSEEDRGTV